MTNKFSELYELTKKFNNISGASKELSQKAFIEQYTYIREEFHELTSSLGGETAYDENRMTLEDYMLVPALDDCLDIIITVMGFLQKLEALGVNVDSAAVATAENNLSKYTNSPYVAQESVDRYARQGVEVTSVFHQDENCYVLRDVKTGKVKKPFNFVSNDLGKFVSKRVEENYGKHN